MNTEIVNGIESIEFGVPGLNYALPSSWTFFNNIADGSVSYTSNKDTETAIIPEDKDVALITLYTPGANDTFNFDLLELSEANYALLFNVIQNTATSSTTVLATKLRANLAIRVTTRAQFGLKKVYVFPNTVCNPTYKNNFTKNALVAISVEAQIYSYVDPDSQQDAVYTMQTVNADGSTIDQTLPTVSAGANQTLTAGATTATLTGTATADGTNTVSKTTWAKTSGPSGGVITSPNSLTTGLTALVPGTYKFTLTVVDNVGNTSTATTTVIAS
jgi:hypothetical protein